MSILQNISHARIPSTNFLHKKSLRSTYDRKYIKSRPSIRLTSSVKSLMEKILLSNKTTTIEISSLNKIYTVIVPKGEDPNIVINKCYDTLQKSLYVEEIWDKYDAMEEVSITEEEYEDMWDNYEFMCYNYD